METQENQANTNETEKEAAGAANAEQQHDVSEPRSEETTPPLPSALLAQPLFPETPHTGTTLDFNTLSPEMLNVLRQMQQEETFGPYGPTLDTYNSEQQRFRLRLDNDYSQERFEGLRDIIEKKGFCLNDNIRFGDVDAGDLGIQFSMGRSNRCAER